MTVGSLFTGVGGFDLAFEQAGYTVAWQCEQDAKAQRVLRHRWPGVPLHDDVRTIGAHNLTPVDVLCAGFPCQDLSVAGQRAGLAGGRSGLFHEAVRIAYESSIPWLVLENVPGLLTSHRGRDFHTVLATLAEFGFHDRAYRILDSRHFRVAQRRRRVFLVCHLGAECGRAGAVLLEPTGGGRHPAAGGEAGARVAATLRGRSHGPGVNAPGRGGEDDTNLVAFDTTQVTSPLNRSNPQPGDPCHPLAAGAHAPAIAFNWQTGGDCRYGFSELASALSTQQTPAVFATLNSGGNSGGFRTEPGEHLVGVELSHALTSSTTRSGRMDPNGETYVAYQESQSGVRTHDTHATLDAHNGSRRHHGAMTEHGVRRLTPLECERLQGFPDGWTCLCPAKGHTATCVCPDSPRYKQMGNAVTVPVVRWIAARLAAIVAKARVA